MLWVGVGMRVARAVEEPGVAPGNLGSGLSFAANMLCNSSQIFPFSGLPGPVLCVPSQP